MTGQSVRRPGLAWAACGCGVPVVAFVLAVSFDGTGLSLYGFDHRHPVTGFDFGDLLLHFALAVLCLLAGSVLVCLSRGRAAVCGWFAWAAAVVVLAVVWLT